MKVAVSSESMEEDSRVSDVSGRAPYYLIFDKSKLVKVLKNPFRIGGGGAGFGVAEMLSEEGVDAVISGKIGQNMKSALDERGIKYFEMSGITISDALKEVEK